jgi:nucleoredoxin
MASSATASPSEASFSMESLLGPQLLKSVSESGSTTALLKDTKLVCLYFSASWCPPCVKFSPLLKEFYKNTSRQDIQIVYVSSDRSLDEFKNYYGSMPWLAIPTDAKAAQVKTNLANKFRLTGIPTLIVLDAKSGLFVTSQARQQVHDLGTSVGDKDVARKLVQQWIAQDKVPIDQAHLLEPPQNILVQILLAVMKNPMYMFGLLYLFKMVMRYVKGTESAETDTPPLGQDNNDEF